MVKLHTQILPQCPKCGKTLQLIVSILPNYELQTYTCMNLKCRYMRQEQHVTT